MLRRFLLSATVLIPIAACGSLQVNPGNITTVHIDLATAQKQAQAMADALSLWAEQAAGTMTGAAGQNLQKALAAMNGTVAAFVGLPSGQSPTAAQYAEAAAKAIMTVIPLLPIPAAAKIAIEAGLAVIEAFAAGISAITVPSTPLALRRGHRNAIQAPVPVPIPD